MLLVIRFCTRTIILTSFMKRRYICNDINMTKKPFHLLCLPTVGHMDQILDKFSFPVTLCKGDYKDLEFIFKGRKTTILHKGRDLKDFSFVWLSSSWSTRDLAYTVRLYLEQIGVPYTHVEKGTSKVTDQMAFALSGIQSPDTLFLGSRPIRKNLLLIKKVCGYPLVIKDIKGCRGSNSEYVATEKELLKKMKNLPTHKKYLFQKYIPNEYDWGVIVANGKVVSGEKSYPSEGEFRNNKCNGATEVYIDPKKIPSEIKQMAVNACGTLGLSWSRADIIIDKKTKKPYLLEVNRFPGIASETTDVDGAYTFLASHITRLKKNG
jgi:glutathione synthase/RimK-type ligase-like ATP-grasp enzyme